MFIHTDFLRAALCCVAEQTEERRYLQGVHITSTHIQACNRAACVSMEHGASDAIEGVFILHGVIPDEAEGTYIKPLYGALVAEHVTADNKVIGRSNLESVQCQYPDFSKLLAGEPEPCDTFPVFQAKYLALPFLMFGFDFGVLPVQFKPWGNEKPCQIVFDSVINKFYGNPQLVIMPMRNNAFELMGALLNEESC
ncbi:hypothetical protein [Mixta mediterraneensis]|uniref:hypothetical protein n=1 Tax=Mixta mediterraneensis TaxID=2758443 RepID=UPI001873C197|nr:hypothetical protein [Mixta mediterraneensis]MBE5251766.1 hypothetical protein [Mixta mediterraneensis]